MAFAIDSYEAARELDEPALRGLLDHGRPEERVWAIWALALRSVAHVAGLARRDEPDPGVRRTLAVVLAGHGELELLVQLALRDPAPEVRGAALQLVARLACDGKLPSALVEERVRADVPTVKLAVLGIVGDDAPPWLRALAEQLLADRDADVRYEAFEALIRAGDRGPALMWLEEAPEAEGRLALMRWTAPGAASLQRAAGKSGLRVCAEILAASSRRLRRLLIDAVRAPSWADLAPAVGDDASLLRALVQRNAAELDRVPLAPLVKATLVDERGGWLAAIRARLAALDTAPDDVAPLLPALYELCARRIAELERELARWRDERGNKDAADDIALELEDARLAIEATLDQISRLLVH